MSRKRRITWKAEDYSTSVGLPTNGNARTSDPGTLLLVGRPTRARGLLAGTNELAVAMHEQEEEDNLES